MLWTVNSYHFQNHSLVKGKGTGVSEVAGPFVSYYALSFKKAIGVSTHRQNHSVETRP